MEVYGVMWTGENGGKYIDNQLFTSVKSASTYAGIELTQMEKLEHQFMVVRLNLECDEKHCPLSSEVWELGERKYGKEVKK